MYLSKAYECLDGKQRDILLRLLVEEEARMGTGREHIENGHRRLNDCRDRVRRQREVVAAVVLDGVDRSQEEFLLQTFERTLLLIEDHQRLLLERYRQQQL